MFSNIKYNLYEILNVAQNSDDKTIKKQYLKLIKKFHPDKNNKIEEEIYFHILYANQILLDSNLRMKYNEFIKETTDFNTLKNDSKKSLNEDFTLSKAESLNEFNKKFEELNNKHGFKEDNNTNSKSNFEFKRDNINIDKNINPKDMKEFNKIFLKNKNNSFKDQIIEYKGEPMEITTYINKDNYAFINDLEKLYIDDLIGNNSLEIAFSLQPFTDI